jgi:hypothetical protein
VAFELLYRVWRRMEVRDWLGRQRCMNCRALWARVGGAIIEGDRIVTAVIVDVCF